MAHKKTEKNPFGAGRPKGAIPKKKQALQDRLEEVYDFRVEEKMIENYERAEQVFLPLFLRILDGIPLNSLELELYKTAGSEMRAYLIKLFSHTYPQLKAIDVGQEGSKPVTLNLTIPNYDGGRKMLTDDLGNCSDTVIDIPVDAGRQITIAPDKV